MAEADESAARHVELLTTAELITGLVCYPIACLVGLVTNALCLLVFLRPDMRGLSTNTYLAALALADLMKLANDFVYTPGVLVKMLEHSDAAFPRYYPYAYFFNQFLASVTAWLTVAVAMERFLLVLRPVDSRAYLTLRKARIECAAVFVGLFLLNLPGIFRYRPVVRAPTTGRGGGNSTRSGSIESLETSWFWRLDQFKQAYIIPQTVLRSILPICLMIVLNITIIVALRRRFNWRRRQKLVSADVFAVSSGLRPSPRPQPASAWRVLTRHAGLGPGPGSGCQTLSNGRLAAEEAGSAELAPERRETAVGDAKQRLPVRHRVTIMLVAVMSGFVLLASPDALLSLLGWGYYDAPETWIRAIREITDCLLVVNSDTNFFLYYSLNPKFRNALRDSLRRLAWPPRLRGCRGAGRGLGRHSGPDEAPTSRDSRHRTDRAVAASSPASGAVLESRTSSGRPTPRRRKSTPSLRLAVRGSASFEASCSRAVSMSAPASVSLSLSDRSRSDRIFGRLNQRRYRRRQIKGKMRARAGHSRLWPSPEGDCEPSASLRRLYQADAMNR